MSTAVDSELAELAAWRPLTRADLDVPADSLGRSPRATYFDLTGLWHEGRALHARIMRQHFVARAGRPFSTHFPESYIRGIMADAWSGQTISCLTGNSVEPSAGYAVTIGPGRESHGEAVTFATLAPYVGVFHDSGKGTVDVDPVAIVDTLREADALGVYCGSRGGAYCFADGLGYWAPVL